MVKCRAKTVKQKVKHKIKEYSNKQIMEATERKSKLKHLVVTSYDNTLDMRKQQPYMNTNNRGECSAIFSTRTLMLIKNYSSKHADKSCRFCKTQESETQTHILEKCKEFETEAKYIDQHHLKSPKEYSIHVVGLLLLQRSTNCTHSSCPPQWGPVSTVFWAGRPSGPAGWLAKLLLKAGDVKTNPGPKRTHAHKSGSAISATEKSLGSRHR